MTEPANITEVPSDPAVHRGAAGLGERRLFIGEVKSVDRKTRSFEGWASVEEIDRYKEVIRAEAFKKWLPRFMSNPVMLWAHDHRIPAVGHYENVEIVPGKGLRFRGVFAETELGEQLLSLYDGKHLRAVSVGFIPHVGHAPTEEDLKAWPGVQYIFDEAELLEISPVNVPACAGALVGKSAEAIETRALDELLDLLREMKTRKAPIGPSPRDAGEDAKKPKRPVDYKAAAEELKGMEKHCAELYGEIKGLREGMESDGSDAEKPEDQEDEKAAGAAFEDFRKAMEAFKAALS
jgi:HK97 family phage prohead protease